MSVKPLKITNDELKKACQKLDIIVPEHILTSLGTYLELLMQWNKVMNLVGTKTWQECLNTLIIDSFHVAKFLPTLNLPKNLTTWDLGAGAGLPGIALRMLWTDGTYYLVEAREKRSLFLQTVLARIKLENTLAFQGRAENFFTKHANTPADMVISRAFMPWQEVLELTKPHILPTAQVVFLSLDLAQDTELHKLGWKLVAKQYYMAANSQRVLWSAKQY